MALPTIAQMKLEVANPNDTVLCMEEISDSSWTVTLPNEKVEDRLLFLLTAAIGNEHFAFAYNMARGNIYRLSNGEHMRNVFGERTFFDQFEGMRLILQALLPTHWVQATTPMPMRFTI